MKKLLTIVAFGISLVQAYAQQEIIATEKLSEETDLNIGIADKKTQLQPYVQLRSGILYTVKKGKESLMKREVETEDGGLVLLNGIVAYPDGSSTKLRDGDIVAKDGTITHDNMAYLFSFRD